jgi:hypothetical protein
MRMPPQRLNPPTYRSIPLTTFHRLLTGPRAPWSPNATSPVAQAANDVGACQMTGLRAEARPYVAGRMLIVRNAGRLGKRRKAAGSGQDPPASAATSCGSIGGTRSTSRDRLERVQRVFVR